MAVREVMSDVAKVAPPVGVSGWAILGYNLPLIIQILTVIYVSAQIVLTILKLKGIKDGQGSCQRK